MPEPPPRPLLSRVLERTDELFPFGRAALMILGLAVVAGAWIVFHPIPRTDANLRLWTFAREHAWAYEKARGRFEQQHPGAKVNVQFVHMDAITIRMRAAMQTDRDVPELAEVEISSAGSFFRGPADKVGFVDLKPMLEKAGLYEHMVQSRFAPYTYKGHIFGLPHDVHPVMLAYRADTFAALGLNADELDTWDKFIAAARKVCIRIGATPRYMLGLNPSGSDSYEVLLFQRGGGYCDAQGRVIMDDELAIQTMLWFIPLVAGPEKIGFDAGWGPAFSRNLEQDRLLAVICPDWRSKGIENDMPRLAGKMKLMPLPAFEAGGRRTSTWGGTMIGITTKAPDPQAAFDLARFLYLDVDDLGNRFRELNILPAYKEAWKHPIIDEPREFWCGQPIGRLYANLGDQVPAQYTSPFVVLAKAKMGEVVASCAVYYDRNGDRGFEAFVREKMKSAADAVRNQMKRNPF